MSNKSSNLKNTGGGIPLKTTLKISHPLSFSFITTAVLAAFSSSAWAIDVTEPTFPEFTIPSVCDGENCKKYEGASSSMMQTGQAFFWITAGSYGPGTQANSFGNSTSDGTKLTNQTVIVDSWENLTGVIYAASSSDRQHVRRVDNNTLYITGTPSTDIIGSPTISSSTQGQGSYYTGSIVAGSSTVGGVSDNTLYVKDATINSTTNYFGMAAGSSSIGQGDSSGNKAYIDNLTLTTSGATYRAFVNALRLSTTTSNIVNGDTLENTPQNFNSNDLFIRNSNLFVSQVSAVTLVNSQADLLTLANGNRAYIDNSNLIVYDAANTTFDNNISGVNGVHEATNNNLFINGGTLRIYDRVTIGAATGFKVSALNNQTTIRNYTIGFSTLLSTDEDITGMSVNGATSNTNITQDNVEASANILDIDGLVMLRTDTNTYSALFTGLTYHPNANTAGEQLYVTAQDNQVAARNIDAQNGIHSEFRGVVVSTNSLTVGSNEPVDARYINLTAGSNHTLIENSQLQSMVGLGVFIRDDSNTASVESTRNGVSIQNTSIANENSYLFGTLVYGADPDKIAVTDNYVAIGNNVTGANNSGVPHFKAIYGGATSSDTGTSFTAIGTGSSFYTASAIETEELGGFSNYNFIVTTDSFKDGAVVTVTDFPVVIETTGENMTHFGVAVTGSALGAGTYSLINSAKGFENENGEALAAGTLLDLNKVDLTLQTTESLARISENLISKDDYELALDSTGNNLDMIITEQTGGDEPGPGGEGQPGSDTVNPETDVLMQASIASLASLYASDDLLVDTALKSRAGKRLSGPFAAARAGTWSNDASSRFDTDIYSGLLGWAFSAADVEFGPFVEMGRGNYEMSQGAEGHHNYVGAGVYANWQTPFYVRLTGYLKGGAMENNFHTSLVGQNVDFDNTTAYWGAHLGMNLDIDLTEKFRARPFLSYFYDGRESDSFTQEGAAVDGATFNFDTINAHRVQLGAMFEYAYSETARPYFGITYEHVIKAEANGTAVDSQGQLSLNSSDIEGATGIVSAGWSYVNPAQDFEFNFGVNGYGGTRNGVSAQMSANWLF